jgi:hypothetical protein
MVNEMRSVGKKLKLILVVAVVSETVTNRRQEKHYSNDRGVYASRSEVIHTHYLLVNYIPMF